MGSFVRVLRISAPPQQGRPAQQPSKIRRRISVATMPITARRCTEERERHIGDVFQLLSYLVCSSRRNRFSIFPCLHLSLRACGFSYKEPARRPNSVGKIFVHNHLIKNTPTLLSLVEGKAWRAKTKKRQRLKLTRKGLPILAFDHANSLVNWSALVNPTPRPSRRTTEWRCPGTRARHPLGRRPRSCRGSHA